MSAGTLSLTNGSTTVGGTGTGFTTELAVGDFVYVSVGGAPYTLVVASVASDTSLTLAVAYDGPTTSGLAWNAVPASVRIAITQKILNDFATVARGQILEKSNWQKIYSSNQSVTVTLPDRSTFTGPSWGYLSTQLSGKLDKSGGALTGDVTGTAVKLSSGLTTGTTVQVNNGTDTTQYGTLGPGWLELSSSTPFIDFHYNKTTADYSTRLIATDTAALEVSALSGAVSFRVNGGMRIGSNTIAGGINYYAGNGNDIWGLSAGSGGVFSFAYGGTNSTKQVTFPTARMNGVTGLQGCQGINGTSFGSYHQQYWAGSVIQAWVDSSQIGTYAINALSDKMLKTEPAYKSTDDAAKALEEVSQWKVATFRYKARGILEESGDKLGFIANDLVLVSPETVTGTGLPEDYDAEKNPNDIDTAYGLDQIAMIAKLTQAIQAQQQLIENQSEAITALRERLTALEGTGS